VKINKLAFGITLALAPVMFTGAVSASNSFWWEDYSSNAGFVEALPHIGYSLEELRHDPNKGLKDSTDSRTPLFWLKRTMNMYPPSTPDLYNMPVVHHETQDWPNGLYATMGRGIFFFTRTFGEAGQTITINTGNIPAGARCFAATGRDFTNKDEMYLDQQSLTSKSANSYTFKKSGILLLGCGDPDKQQNGQFVPLNVIGGDKSNLFILGQSTQNDWQAAKTTASHNGFAFLYDGHANTVVPNKMAQSTNEIIGKELGYNLRTIALYEKVNGMDGSDPLFISSMGSMFTNYDTCCYADYRNGYVGVGFNSDKMHNDWGVWHEFGHEYEPTREALNLFSEIQVNRYSLEACQMFKGREIPLNQCHSDISPGEGNWDNKAVEKFIASNVHYQDYSAIKDLWKQLGFFSRLRFSYGDNFFPQVNQARLKAIQSAPGISIADKTNYVLGSKEKVIDFSVVAYSKAAGYDLRQYFIQWGLPFSAQASQKVADMNLPQPGEEKGLEVSLSRDKIAAVATYNTSFGYSITASSNQGDVSYRWKRIAGDARIYTKTQDGPKVEVVIPKNIEGVSARFEVTAENRIGEDKKTFDVIVLIPKVEIDAPVSMASQTPIKLEANANFDEAKFEWVLLKGTQIVKDGIDREGVVKKGLEAGRYNVKVVANSIKGARSATQVHSLEITDAAQNKDQAFVDAAKLVMQSNESSEGVNFSGDVTSESDASSMPVYQWILPSNAQGGSNGKAQQRFTVAKTTSEQHLQVKVKVTAGQHTRQLEQNIVVPALTGGNDEIPDWVYGSPYLTGNVVKHNGKIFECVVAGWCSQTGQWSQFHYEPGVGISWTQAWKLRP